jgi:hypothetical protein
MNAKNIRGGVADHLAASALALIGIAAGLVFIVTLAFSGSLPFIGTDSGTGSAGQERTMVVPADGEGIGILDRADSLDALPGQAVVTPDAPVYQGRSLERPALAELQLFEEPALHNHVPERVAPRAEYPLWVLEEPRMHHLPWIESEMRNRVFPEHPIYEEPGMHHYLVPNVFP